MPDNYDQISQAEYSVVKTCASSKSQVNYPLLKFEWLFNFLTLKTLNNKGTVNISEHLRRSTGEMG